MTAPEEIASLEEDNYISPPIRRAARLLRHIAQGDLVVNMARTARELGINRTTLLRILRTLESEGLIEQRGGEGAGWRISAGLIGLVAQAFSSDDMIQIAEPILTRLVETLQLSAHLGVLDGLEVVYLLKRTPNSAFASNIRVGSRLPAYAASMGRIILAHLPPEKVARMYSDVPMPAITPQTAVTVEQLLAKVAQDRATGLAWSNGQYEPDISSVAAAILNPAGAPIAAINVTGQPSQFGGEGRQEEIGQATASAARDISKLLFLAGHTHRDAAKC